MKIKLKFGEQSGILDIAKRSCSLDVIRKIDQYPDAVIVFREGMVVPDDEELSEGDSLEIIRISSGG